MKVLRKIQMLILAAVLIGGPIALATTQQVNALGGSDFRADRIIDDGIFFDGNAMTAGDVQAFLNSIESGCTGYCLKDFQEDMSHFPADGYCSAVNAARKSAAQIIKDVASACSISPKVILVLLEKEQGLVTSTAPSEYKYTYATGFCVPDGPPPPACEGTYGFSNQVYYGARQYQKYAKQPNSFTYRAGEVGRINWHPNGGCGTSDVFMQNQATAGLYNYTPYRPNAAALNNLYGTGDGCSAYGNRNFWRIFSDWFGSPVTSHCLYGSPTASITDVKYRKFRKNVDYGNFVIYQGSSTNCIESHTWTSGFNSWQDNTASNQPIISPADGTVKYADLTGDGIDEPILVTYNNTGSGKVEFHVWDITMRRWLVHAASNLPTAAIANNSIEFADVDGNGIDDPVAITYKDSGSGFVEMHFWSPGLQAWSNHVITNLGAPINPLNIQVAFADLNGDGRDEGVALGVGSTGSGNIEFHVWSPGMWAWQSHIVSNQATLDASICETSFGDFDGNRIDNGVVTCKSGTASGMIELHVWNTGLATWQGHYSSNQPSP